MTKYALCVSTTYIIDLPDGVSVHDIYLEGENQKGQMVITIEHEDESEELIVSETGKLNDVNLIEV